VERYKIALIETGSAIKPDPARASPAGFFVFALQEKKHGIE